MDFQSADFRTKTFVLDKDISSMMYEVKRTRAVWDPSLSVPGTDRRGGWRCPVGTRYGGQITDRFGRNCGWGVVRRLGMGIAKLGENLEDIADRRRENRVARRNERMLRFLAENGSESVSDAIKTITAKIKDDRKKRKKRGESRAASEVAAEIAKTSDAFSDFDMRSVPDDELEKIDGELTLLEKEIRELVDIMNGDGKDSDASTLEEKLTSIRTESEKVSAELSRRTGRKRQRRRSPDVALDDDRKEPTVRGESDELTSAADKISKTPVPKGDPKDGESLDAYKRRKYNEHQKRVREIRDAGGDAGFLKYEEWDKYHGPIVEHFWNRFNDGKKKPSPRPKRRATTAVAADKTKKRSPKKGLPVEAGSIDRDVPDKELDRQLLVLEEALKNAGPPGRKRRLIQDRMDAINREKWRRQQQDKEAPIGIFPSATSSSDTFVVTPDEMNMVTHKSPEEARAEFLEFVFPGIKDKNIPWIDDKPIADLDAGLVVNLLAELGIIDNNVPFVWAGFFQNDSALPDDPDEKREFLRRLAGDAFDGADKLMQVKDRMRGGLLGFGIAVMDDDGQMVIADEFREQFGDIEKLFKGMNDGAVDLWKKKHRFLNQAGDDDEQGIPDAISVRNSQPKTGGDDSLVKKLFGSRGPITGVSRTQLKVAERELFNQDAFIGGDEWYDKSRLEIVKDIEFGSGMLFHPKVREVMGFDAKYNELVDLAVELSDIRDGRGKYSQIGPRNILVLKNGDVIDVGQQLDMVNELLNEEDGARYRLLVISEMRDQLLVHQAHHIGQGEDGGKRRMFPFYDKMFPDGNPGDRVLPFIVNRQNYNRVAVRDGGDEAFLENIVKEFAQMPDVVGRELVGDEAPAALIIIPNDGGDMQILVGPRRIFDKRLIDNAVDGEKHLYALDGGFEDNFGLTLIGDRKTPTPKKNSDRILGSTLLANIDVGRLMENNFDPAEVLRPYLDVDAQGRYQTVPDAIRGRIYKAFEGNKEQLRNLLILLVAEEEREAFEVRKKRGAAGVIPPTEDEIVAAVDEFIGRMELNGAEAAKDFVQRRRIRRFIGDRRKQNVPELIILEQADKEKRALIEDIRLEPEMIGELRRLLAGEVKAEELGGAFKREVFVRRQKYKIGQILVALEKARLVSEALQIPENQQSIDFIDDAMAKKAAGAFGRLRKQFEKGDKRITFENVEVFLNKYIPDWKTRADFDPFGAAIGRVYSQEELKNMSVDELVKIWNDIKKVDALKQQEIMDALNVLRLAKTNSPEDKAKRAAALKALANIPKIVKAKKAYGDNVAIALYRVQPADPKIVEARQALIDLLDNQAAMPDDAEIGIDQIVDQMKELGIDIPENARIQEGEVSRDVRQLVNRNTAAIEDMPKELKFAIKRRKELIDELKKIIERDQQVLGDRPITVPPSVRERQDRVALGRGNRVFLEDRVKRLVRELSKVERERQALVIGIEQAKFIPRAEKRPVIRPSLQGRKVRSVVQRELAPFGFDNPRGQVGRMMEFRGDFPLPKPVDKFNPNIKTAEDAIKFVNEGGDITEVPHKLWGDVLRESDKFERIPDPNAGAIGETDIYILKSDPTKGYVMKGQSGNEHGGEIMGWQFIAAHGFGADGAIIDGKTPRRGHTAVIIPFAWQNVPEGAVVRKRDRAHNFDIKEIQRKFPDKAVVPRLAQFLHNFLLGAGDRHENNGMIQIIRHNNRDFPYIMPIDQARAAWAPRGLFAYHQGMDPLDRIQKDVAIVMNDPDISDEDKRAIMERVIDVIDMFVERSKKIAELDEEELREHFRQIDPSIFRIKPYQEFDGYANRYEEIMAIYRKNAKELEQKRNELIQRLLNQ